MCTANVKITTSFKVNFMILPLSLTHYVLFCQFINFIFLKRTAAQDEDRQQEKHGKLKQIDRERSRVLRYKWNQIKMKQYQC